MRHNPHPFHIRGARVGILEAGRRAVGGVFATVTDDFWREDSPWLVLQLPDGRRAAAPAAWTDLPADTFPANPVRSRLDPAALPEMARACRRLRRPPAEGPAPLNRGDPWAALPEADRQRLGRHFSRLVLRMIDPPAPEPEAV